MIRSYKTEDKAYLVALFNLNSPQYFHNSEKQSFINYLENEIEDYFVIEINNSIVGCGGINYELDKCEAIISWDIIHQNYHKRGLGTKLLKHRINHIKDNQSITKVIVRTSQLTKKFYEKSGFITVNTENDYWAEGFHLVEMHMLN